MVTSRGRVLTALKLEVPDRVPWVEHYVSDELVSKLLKRPFKSAPQISVPPEVLEVLSLDNIAFMIRAPEFVQRKEMEGIDYITEGLIKTREDLRKINLPDPYKESFYEPACNFLKKYKKDCLALASMRSGIARTYLSMGIDTFSLALTMI